MNFNFSVKKLNWYVLGFFFIAVLLFIRVLFDTDLGWHLMVGKYIIEHQSIPKTDIFTWSAPDYPYVYHSWLSEVILYIVYHLAGMWGTTLLYAVVGALILLVMLKIIWLYKRKESWTYWYFLLTIPIILDASNLRIQLFSFLGLSLIYYFYLKLVLKGGKAIYFIPLILVLWVNLHAGFIVGLILLGLLLVIELVKIGFKSFISTLACGRSVILESKKIRLLSLVLGLSMMVCLLNPYGIRAYQQALSMGTNKFAMTFNSDWYPIVRVDAPETFVFATLIFLAMISCLSLKNKLDLREKILMTLFFLLSLKNRRFVVPLLVILIPSLPIVLEPIIDKFKTMFNKLYPINKFFYPLFIFVALVSGLLWIPRTLVAYQNDKTYSDAIRELSSQVFYPYEAVQYMNQNLTPYKIFNDFNWGGYLVWQMPGIKTYIDGRMDNFIINGESFAKQYLTIVNLLPGWQELIDKYQIDTFLLATNHPIVEALKIMPEWNLVYEDSVAIIFQKQL